MASQEMIDHLATFTIEARRVVRDFDKTTARAAYFSDDDKAHRKRAAEERLVWYETLLAAAHRGYSDRKIRQLAGDKVYLLP